MTIARSRRAWWVTWWGEVPSDYWCSVHVVGHGTSFRKGAFPQNLGEYTFAFAEIVSHFPPKSRCACGRNKKDNYKATLAKHVLYFEDKTTPHSFAPPVVVSSTRFVKNHDLLYLAGLKVNSGNGFALVSLFVVVGVNCRHACEYDCGFG